MVADGGFGAEFAYGAAVAQALRGDRVEVTAADNTPVERCTVSAQGDAVGAEAAVGDGCVGAGLGVDGFAPDEGGEA